MGDIKPDTKGRWYDYYLPSWTKIDTIKRGESAIKEAATLYLPKLSGQSIEDYKAYLERGSFFNAFSRTIVGLTGAVMQKKPRITASKETEEELRYVTLAGESIEEVARVTVENVLEFGYYGILVDAAPALEGVVAEPYFALYDAPSILNFRTEQIGSENKLMMLCLLEEHTSPNPENPFEDLIQGCVRVLLIDDDGFMVNRLYEKKTVGKDVKWVQIGEDIYPTIRGKKLTEIPFVFFGAISNSPIPSQPPLIDLANLNIKHWQVSVDYYHGLHYCAIPTPWAAGFEKTTELYIGAMKAWVSEDSAAHCGFLEFTGQGLNSIKDALLELESRMAILGARMLEEQKKAAEAAETVLMRYSGDTATLSNVVNSVETGLTKAIYYYNMWKGKTEAVEVTLNNKFVPAKMTSAELTALVASWQQGAISFETLFDNLQAGEIITSDITAEQEQARIAAGGAMLPQTNNEEETNE